MSKARTEKQGVRRREEEESKSVLELEREKFLKASREKKRVLIGRRRAGDEASTLAKLQAFQQKLKHSKPVAVEPADGEKFKEMKAETTIEKEGVPCDLHTIPNCKSCALEKLEQEETNLDPNAWMAHALRFEKDMTGKNLLDPNARRIDNVEDLMVIDPRERKQQFSHKDKHKK